MAAKYRAGVLTIPGSTGNHAVTGLGFAPDCVIFIGGNGSSEDTVLTGNNLGVFMGIMGRDWDTDAIKAYSVSTLPEQGARVRTAYPICQAATCNSAAFEASAVSLDSDGFTVNFTTVGTGVVYYLAIKADNVAYLETAYGAGGTVALGWTGRTNVSVGYRAGGDMLSGDVFCDLHHSSFGGGSWKTGQNDIDGMGGFMQVIRGNAGRHECESYDNPPGVTYGYTGIGASYIGPFLGSNFQHGLPTGASRTDFTYGNGGQCKVDRLILSIEGVQGRMTPPDGAGNDVDVDLTYNPVIDRADAVLGYTVADTTDDANNPCAMIGFSIACKQDGGVFHAGVLADGVASPRTLYQSAQDMVFDVDGSDVLTGRLDFDAPSVGNMRLTTEIDGVSGTHPSMVFHAYGREVPPVSWIPEFQRLRRRG